MKSLPVNEMLYTWQGEGAHMGKPAFFIRLQGCPVKCPWCDAANTWHPEHVPDNIKKYTIGELVSAAIEHNPAFVVITGGEPAIYDLTRLVVALKAYNLPVHLETCGAFEIKGDFDWITLSPKFADLPIRENVITANELKIIVDNADAIAKWENLLKGTLGNKTVWLHPEWSLRDNPEIRSIINNKVKERKHNYRAGFQLHKLYNVDEESAFVHQLSENEPRHLFGKTGNIC